MWQSQVENEHYSTLSGLICKSYSEAIKWLDDIKLFLESKGQCEEASAIGLAAESVAAVHLRSKRQTSILDYCTYHLTNKL